MAKEKPTLEERTKRVVKTTTSVELTHGEVLERLGLPPNTTIQIGQPGMRDEVNTWEDWTFSWTTTSEFAGDVEEIKLPRKAFELDQDCLAQAIKAIEKQMADNKAYVSNMEKELKEANFRLASLEK